MEAELFGDVPLGVEGLPIEVEVQAVRVVRDARLVLVDQATRVARHDVEVVVEDAEGVLVRLCVRVRVE